MPQKPLVYDAPKHEPRAVSVEAIQAEILKNMYSIWFSHPAMEAAIYWNLVDGYAAFAKQGDMTNGENYFHGGLLHFDMSPKPAYLELDRLINHEWRTNEELDGASEVTFRGFHGDYEGVATVGGKSVPIAFHIGKGQKNTFEFVL